MASSIREWIKKALEKNNGILRMDPAWVARDFLPPGKRLCLKEEEYDVGERGYICERWLASTTKADNAISPPDEGLSYISRESLPSDCREPVLLRDAVEAAGDLIIGKEYAKTHKGLGRLAKIYDFAARIPYHIHQMEKDAALVGRNSKEEAYYFPEDVDVGPHPETFFGVHPYITEQKKYDVLLPYLVEWKDDLILRHSRAYLLVPGEGFHLPVGVLHAPGTALTIELQEDSDVFAMLQALNAGKIISKDLLFKDVRKEDREKYGERTILSQINWEISGDPYFFENRHMPPVLIKESKQPGGEEHWIYYNTTKFSGKKLVIKPNQRFTSIEKGVYSVLVWKGKGRFDGKEVEAGNFEMDELLIAHNRAMKPHVIENTGDKDMQIIKFFGPDINLDIPKIPRYK